MILGSLAILLALLGAVAAQNYSVPAASFTGSLSIQPYFSPDNSLNYLTSLINSAVSTLDLSLQYATLFNATWATDANPLPKALLSACSRGVAVRVILEQDADSDDFGGYLAASFASSSCKVKYIRGLNWNHNKGLLIDRKVVSISSVNWSKGGLSKNREVGVTFQQPTLAEALRATFETDWTNGVLANATSSVKRSFNGPSSQSDPLHAVVPHFPRLARRAYTNLPLPAALTLSSTAQTTVFTNPDSAYSTILSRLNSMTSSFDLAIYSMSLKDAVDSIISLRKRNPSAKIRVLVSHNRATASENTYTANSIASLRANWITVRESTPELTFLHAKYWIADGSTTTIYSGNWAGSSISQSVSVANREWGVEISDRGLASYFTNLFERDWNMSSGVDWTSGIGIINLVDGQIISSALELGVAAPSANSVSATLDSKCTSAFSLGISEPGASLSNSIPLIWTVPLDPSKLCQGTHTLSLRADLGTSTKSTNVTLNVVRGAVSVLITEVLYNGLVEGTDEFVELGNLHTGSISLAGWTLSRRGTKFFTFSAGTTIASAASIVVANNKTAYLANFGRSAQFESSGVSFTNSYDEVELRDSAGNLVDALGWGASAAGYLPTGYKVFSNPSAAGNMQSLQRRVNKTTYSTEADKEFYVGAPTAGQLPGAVIADTACVEGCGAVGVTTTTRRTSSTARAVPASSTTRAGTSSTARRTSSTVRPWTTSRTRTAPSTSRSKTKTSTRVTTSKSKSKTKTKTTTQKKRMLLGGLATED